MSDLKPQDIEKKSMEIIDNQVDLSRFTEKQVPIVKRIIHTTGDLDIYNQVLISNAAVSEGILALTEGKHIFTDVEMVVAGLNKQKLTGLGCQINCAINQPHIKELANKSGKTRAKTAIETYGKKLHGQIVLIGNAPTALFELIRLHREQGITPALVVGVPVGFVGAMESKDLLTNTQLTYITITRYKGGSPIAATVINALLRMI